MDDGKQNGNRRVDESRVPFIRRCNCMTAEAACQPVTIDTGAWLFAGAALGKIPSRGGRDFRHLRRSNCRQRPPWFAEPPSLQLSTYEPPLSRSLAREGSREPLPALAGEIQSEDAGLSIIAKSLSLGNRIKS